jgi:predicted O-methyltransferase YrrM
MTQKYYDRILPNQDFNSNLFKGENDNYMLSLFKLVNDFSSDIDFKKFKLNEHHRVSFEEMSTPPVQLALLKFLIGMTNTKKFLEIGTFIGNTAMHVADFIGKDANVVTLEKFDEFADLANKNFKDNKLENKITLHQGDAYDCMKSLDDNFFDFIYVDGDKGRYPELTALAEKKLSKNGLILIDDVFFHGDVFNDKQNTDKGLGCKTVIEQYKNNKTFNKYLMPINNGILLLKRI